MWRKKNNNRGKNPASDDDDDDSIPPPPPPMPPQERSPASGTGTNHDDHSQYTDDYYMDEDGSTTQKSKATTAAAPSVNGQRTVSGTSKQYSVKKPYESIVANQTHEEEEAGMDDIEVHNSPVVKRLNAHERKKRLQKCCIILVVLVVIVLVIALGAGLGSGNSNSGGESNTSGNNSPSSLNFFISSLGVSDSKALADTSSPQYAALNWLKNGTSNTQYKFDSDAITSNSTLQLIAKQRYAAATIYYSLQGKSWTNSSGWMSSSDVCTWNGVFCGTDSSNATVEAFILDGQNLNGTLPSEIQIFDSLSYLSLYYNNLGGSIPSGLFSLTKLQYLDLTSNVLSGQISSKIGQLSNLVYLYFGSNRFNGVIPTSLGLLTGLVQLWMDTNSFSSSVATIPTQLGQLTNLTSLRMQNMGGQNGGVGGKIPSALGNLQRLVDLQLAFNDLGKLNSTSYGSTVPTELGKLTSLRTLDLSSTWLSGSLPSTFINLKNLTSLKLDNCLFSGSMPSFMANLTALVTLTLNNNKYNDTYARSNGFNGSIPTFLSNLKSSTSITLQGNSFNGSVPVSVCQALNNQTISICTTSNACSCCKSVCP